MFFYGLLSKVSSMNLKTILALSVFVFFGFTQPKIVRADESKESIPKSHDSPEGVAVDLGQAFISRDFHAFNEARAKSFCEVRTDPFNYYVRFRNNTTLFGMGESFNETNLSSPPLRISRVYSAQPLAAIERREISGAFSLSGWIEPTLVDVVIEDRQGNELLHRTIVVKSKSSELWYAQPQLVAHDYLSELLLELPRSESVSWQIAETSDDRK